MKKTSRVLAAVLTLVLCLSCFAAAEEAKSGLLATVNGVDLPIDEAMAEYEYYAYMYQYYGMGDDELQQLREDIAKYYVQMYLISAKADELGLTENLDVEAVTADAKAEYEETLALYADYYGDASLSDEENRANAAEILASENYTEEIVIDYAVRNAGVQAVIDYYTADVTVEEDEISAAYEERVASDKEYFESDPSYFEDAVSYGDAVYYTPEGFRTVKHILVCYSEEDQDRMYELETELSSVESALQAEGADVEALNGEKTAIEAEMAAIVETVMPKIGEIQARLAAGEDFLALLEEYGEDPGMQSEPHATDGYLVCADSVSWVTPFRDGAMALENVGDVSGPVSTSYGVHLIRYEKEMVPGAVPLEEVREALTGELRDMKVSEIYTELVEGWYEEAEVVLYLENFETEEAVAE